MTNTIKKGPRLSDFLRVDCGTSCGVCDLDPDLSHQAILARIVRLATCRGCRRILKHRPQSACLLCREYKGA